MPPPTIPPPSHRQLLPPLLASLPAAAVSSQPPAVLLPILSPILRQRVQLLSVSTNDPWLPLLCYDQDKAGKLLQVAKSNKFEPHPVSGEVEVDWDGEVETRYRRIDEETLETYVWLRGFDLNVKLLWCLGDPEGGGDGWKIGEVSVLENSLEADNAQRGWESIGEAEGHYKDTTRKAPISRASDAAHSGHTVNGHNGDHHIVEPQEDEDDEDDDDAYWAQYDNTPARTPAPKHSPAPEPTHNGPRAHHNDEDAYYAQYSTVQPAMDNHDPDEASQSGTVETTLDRSTLTQSLHQPPSPSSASADLSSTHLAWQSNPSLPTSEQLEEQQEQPHPSLVQPRPTSSSSSSSSSTVAKLENEAESLSFGRGDIGVKQHISTSVKSLFRLARAAGMERVEFERLVRTELEVLALMEEDD